MTVTTHDRRPATAAERRAADSRPRTAGRCSGSRTCSKVFYTDEVETHALRACTSRSQRGEYVSIAGPVGLRQVDAALDPRPARLADRRASTGSTASRCTSLALAERARIRNREIGFIFQSFNLIGDLTVFENVELPLTYRGMPAAERKRSASARRSSASAWRTARSTCRASSRAASSSASRWRARWPATRCILLADEPTGNLDSRNGEAVMELLRELHRGGATICMVTHDPRFARYAERTIHLFDGRIVERAGGALMERLLQDLRFGFARCAARPASPSSWCS